MNKTATAINFFLGLTKFQTLLSRRLDSRLGGLGLNEFIILYHLGRADKLRMRRIDLAESLGLTASGVTRLLLPMEKIGLVKRELNPRDARVSYVVLAPGGKTKFNEGLERLEIFGEELIPTGRLKKINDLGEVLKELEKNI